MAKAGRSLRLHRVRLLVRPLVRQVPRLRRVRHARRGALAAQRSGAGRPRRPLLRLVDVEAEEAERIPTGVPELDRVLGGGLVPASLVLVGGEPGVGKSTLLLTALAAMSAASGARSSSPARSRPPRSSCAPTGSAAASNVEILAETELEAVCATLERERPDVCVIDSVQTLYSAELGSAPGSVAQVREAAARLLRVAKEAGVAVFLVGHVTKDGAVAGPRVLEHLVDCVLQFEGDRYREHRILRAAKNRFGSTNEIGVFEMTGTGLVGVPDPSRALRPDRGGRDRRRRRVRARGHAADPARDPGARLPDRPRDAAPRRHRRRPEAAGDDRRRARAATRGLALGQADVFVNVAGGVRIDEPGADLAVALAIASAARGAPVRDGLAAFGEVGLTGRLRPATQAERRLEECAKLGLDAVLAPTGTPKRARHEARRGRDDRAEALAAGLEAPSAEAV